MIIWIIGMSSAGKTVIGKELYQMIKQTHKNTVFLDGDIFRGLHDNDVDHSVPGRKKNSDRLTRICQFLDDQGINVVCSVLSIFPEAQEWNRQNYKEYFEVFLDVSFETLVKRDLKGLYKKALNGEMDNVVGVHIEFPHPTKSNLVIHNEGEKNPDTIAREIFNQIHAQLQ